MNFGELKPGDVLYLIDYNQFKKDLTYIKGLVQTVVVNEPPKENNLNNVYQSLMQKAGVNNQPLQSLTVTALFNGVQFPFTVTKDMSIARANDRTVCITREDVLQEIRIRKSDATNQLKSLDRYNKILEECEKVERELLGDFPISQESQNDDRLVVLERKVEELINLISNGKNKETIGGNGSEQSPE
nr:MAG TPA: hypothetical protein [Caudoviricetes sp.]